MIETPLLPIARPSFADCQDKLLNMRSSFLRLPRSARADLDFRTIRNDVVGHFNHYVHAIQYNMGVGKVYGAFYREDAFYETVEEMKLNDKAHGFRNAVFYQQEILGNWLNPPKNKRQADDKRLHYQFAQSFRATFDTYANMKGAEEQVLHRHAPGTYRYVGVSTRINKKTAEFLDRTETAFLQQAQHRKNWIDLYVATPQPDALNLA